MHKQLINTILMVVAVDYWKEKKSCNNINSGIPTTSPLVKRETNTRAHVIRTVIS